MKAIGKKKWAIADGYILKESHGPEPAFTSHEAVPHTRLDSRQAENALNTTIAYPIE